MSFSPDQPSGSRGTRNLAKPLLALVLLIVVAGGLALLSLGFGRGAPPQAPVSPTPEVAAGTPQRGQGLSGPQPPTPTPLPTQTYEPSPTRPVDTPTAVPTPTPLPAALRSLAALDAAGVPARDLYALAERLKGKAGQVLPRTTDKAPGNYPEGHSDVFNVSDIESRTYYTVSATVKKVTEHAYWYVQDGIATDARAIERMAAAFEGKIYPTNRALFGSEWTPGVDNDPRITILFAPLRGSGGAFSAADEHTRAVNPYSNEREIIYISTGSGWAGLEGTLAHEHQHMIHWHVHDNQDIWLNEGSSVLASALNGFDVLGVDVDFMQDPDVQLNGWQSSPGLARPNYGAAFLFLDYLRSQYGGDPLLRGILSAPEPGTGAVDTALAGLGYKERFAEAFSNWTLANLLDTHPGADKRWTYPDRDVQVSPQVNMDHYPTGYSDPVSQFGADYVALLPPTDGSSALHVDFVGQPEIPIVPPGAHSGSAIWWSNRGDLSDSRLTRRFDLTGLGSATLDYHAWFDIEQDFDYAYVEVSTDGGATWETLQGKYTSSTNPNGTNYGHAYTGKSLDRTGADRDGWVHETLDLSEYAGKEIMVRFEYITDDGYNAQGLAVDDISIPELGYSDDAEVDQGWDAEGFVRVDNTLPQRYFLAVVKLKENGADVQPIEVDGSGEASFTVEGLGPDGPYTSAVLVVAGLTPYTLQSPSYELSVRPAETR